MIAIFSTIIILNSVYAATESTLEDCLAKADSFFCNLNNKSGYCCAVGETSNECIESESVQCTLGDVSIQGEPLYRTYWVGLTPLTCGAESNRLFADRSEQIHKANSMVIEERNSVKYEACHWVIGVEDNTFRDDTEAYLEVLIENMQDADAYIYEGTSRSNVTAFIETNQTAVQGVPYRAPISSNLILVMTTKQNRIKSSASFSYRVYNGIKYPFWQKPFIGQPEWQWYCALGGSLFIILLCITIPICLCKYCQDCKPCCVRQKKQENPDDPVNDPKKSLYKSNKVAV